MTIVDISKFTNTTTVAEIKESIKLEEKEKDKKKKEYQEFVDSFIGKYIFCNHNGTHGFVTKLIEWNKEHDMISITNSGFNYEKRSVSQNWINTIKIITEEQYLEIDKITQEVQRLRNSITLFNK